jgi:regulator of replication initiation timing
MRPACTLASHAFSPRLELFTLVAEALRMPIQPQVSEDAPENDLQSQLFEAWRSRAEHVRFVTVSKIRGRAAVKLPNDCKINPEEGEDYEELLALAIDEVIGYARADIGSKNGRYRFRVYGEPEALGKRAELCEPVDATVSGGDNEDITREGELVGVVAGSARLFDRLGNQYIRLVTVVNTTLEKVCGITEKLGNKLTENDATRAEWAFKIEELRMNAATEQFEAQQNAEARQQAYAAVREMLNTLPMVLEFLRVYLATKNPDIAADPEAHASPPTDDELDAVVGSVDVDLATLLKKIRDERDPQTRHGLVVALQTRWTGLLPQQRVALFASASQLTPERRGPLLAWLVSLKVS